VSAANRFARKHSPAAPSGARAPHEQELLRATSASNAASQVLHMQRVLGNAATRSLLARSAAPAAPQPDDAAHAPVCNCPACVPKRVYTDDPLAPAVQRAEAAHQPGCACPACAQVSAAPAPLQRQPEGGSEEEQQAGEESQNAQGETVSLTEEFEPADSDVPPDLGLHVAMVTGGEQAAEEEAAANSGGLPQAPRITFVNGGRTGTAPVSFEQRAPASDGRPHAFVNGGRTGAAVWAGGGGAGPRGNQAVGSIQSTTNPVYDSASNGVLSDSSAWVRAGTGDLTVTRTYLGANAGDQGNGHYVTALAAARFDAHEVMHVNSTQAIYNANLQPMLDRVTTYRDTGAGTHSKVNAYLQSSAISALQSTIGWANAVSAFQTADTAANAPMNTIDTNDLASGTYPVDRGPGTIAGTAYQHRVTMPTEAAPA